MKRYVVLAALAPLAVLPLVAEAQVPEGWKMRLDRSMNAEDPDAEGEVRFVRTESGFHATNPAAAVFWHSDNMASGEYSIKATFRLMEPSNHTNYYGLVFGGSGLEGPDQEYLYFTVAQDGTWLLKRREGNEAPELSSKTASDAVNTPDASGMSVNELEVRVMADSIEYLVNGTQVHTTPKSGPTAMTDGLYGIRINHRLDVQIDGLELSD